ncbi:MAG: HAD-IA family hydrolase [Nitriliruptoraceae bacterium]|nr:HAD-IA family hydrolase [Nitriliruptoraceae bacterium]
MTTILLGSISSIVDTSELQRRAFNEAFAHHGLGWSWDRDLYRRMLASNGGAARIAAFADHRGEEVDADQVHGTKSARFLELLERERPVARAGVVTTVETAAARGVAVGVVTTTSRANVDAVLAAAGLDPESFALIVDGEQVQRPKPDPQAYEMALRHLDVDATTCVAVEDNAGGIAAARAAGVVCVAFPNENTRGATFPDAAGHVEELHLDALLRTLAGAA